MFITYDLKSDFPTAQTAFALGLFDGIHIGHKKVIDNALMQKEYGYKAGMFTFYQDVNADFYKKDFKYIFSQRAKEKICKNMGIDYFVSPNFFDIKEYGSYEFVKKILKDKLNAKVISCGYDFTFGKDAKGNVDELKDICESLGIKVIIAPPVMDLGDTASSTRIRKLISDGKIIEANHILGRKFFIDFVVTHGNQIGREMDFPTINQSFPKGHIVPKYGVYATKVTVDNNVYAGATNVGVKPTVSVENKVLAETHIIGYKGDLYGKNITVEFLDYIRQETKFDSISHLKQQLEKDKTHIIGRCKNVLHL